MEEKPDRKTLLIVGATVAAVIYAIVMLAGAAYLISSLTKQTSSPPVQGK